MRVEIRYEKSLSPSLFTFCSKFRVICHRLHDIFMTVDPARRLFQGCCYPADDSLHHRRLHAAGAERINSDALSAIFKGSRLR